MTTAADLAEKLEAIKKSIAEQKAIALPKSEAQERFEKIEGDLGTALKAIEDFRIRKTSMETHGDGDMASAGIWLAKNMPLPRTKKREEISLKDICSMSTRRVDHRGITQDALVVPENVKDALKVMDEIYIIDWMMQNGRGKSELFGLGWVEEKRNKGAREAFLKHFPEIAHRHDAIIKAFYEAQGKVMDTSTSGSGSEWVPTRYATNLLDEIRLMMPVTNLIPHIMQPANPWAYPMKTGVGTAYRKVELANITQSTLTTDDRTWTAHVFAVYEAYSDEVDEDSIVAIVPEIRRDLIRALGEGLEEALVSGDSNASGHVDVDYQQATAPYRTYQGGVNGLRQYALDSTSNKSSYDCGTGNALTAANVGAGLALMGKFGANRLSQGEVVHLTDVHGWFDLLTESSSVLQTVDKYGPQANILTGEVGRIYGVPTIISHGVQTRNAAGVANTGLNAATGNTFKMGLLFNRLNWRIGDRRDVRFERDKDIIAGRNDMVISARWSFNAIEGDSTTAASSWNPKNIDGTGNAPVVVLVDWA